MRQRGSRYSCSGRAAEVAAGHDVHLDPGLPDLVDPLKRRATENGRSANAERRLTFEKVPRPSRARFLGSGLRRSGRNCAAAKQELGSPPSARIATIDAFVAVRWALCPAEP
jgi:hypothetical protein